MCNKPELLAPAGDKNCFYTAVNNGADAVYLGLNNFNARMKAENFDRETLKECVDYAHFFGVKVYVTLNILIKDEEMLQALNTVKDALEVGVDAFIVQDLGLIYVLKRCFPDIVLHLSTQAGVHNLEGAKIAERLGVKRVVLSRETKLDDIKAIKKGTNLEIEYFVQGALCVCFSGNCYLSSKEFDASGNRGLCKQLCRLPYKYTLGNLEKSGYVLSAKDLCMLESLKELQEAGVTSFKIEGRMKREGYVGIVVKTYRQALDSKFDKLEIKKALRNLQTAFNRQFLKRAYLDTENENIVNSQTANHIGIEIGEVLGVSPFKNLSKITIKSDTEICKGDGLKFFENSIEKASLGVGSVTKIGKDCYEVISSAKVKPLWKVNLILQAKTEKEVIENKRFCDVNVQIKAYANTPIKIFAYTKDEKIVYVGTENLQQSISSPMTKEGFENNFKKVSDSGFRLKRCDVSTDNVFLSVSKLNEIRREIYEDLKRKIIERHTPKFEDKENYLETFKYMENSENNVYSDRLKDKHQLSAQCQEILHTFYYVYPWTKNVDCECENTTLVLCPSSYDEKGIDEILSKVKSKNLDKALLLPSIANGNDIDTLKKILLNEKYLKLAFVADNVYGLDFIANGFEVYGGAGLNVYNRYSQIIVQNLGANLCQQSAELPQTTHIENTVEISNFLLPMMTFAHCPYKTIYDGSCRNCKFAEDLILSDGKRNFRIERYRVSNCYFKIFKLDE